MLDLKITHGLVLDGSGAPPRQCDVGVRGDRIEGVGDLDDAEARRTIDATGRYVCPGFIDVHSHSDAYLLIEPSAPSKILQGVTTEVVGQCGASAAPLQGEYRMPSDWRDQTFPGTWSSVAEYRELFDAQHPAVNAVLLIGHNTLRAGVMGYAPRPAEEAELAAMEDTLRAALDEGGRGLSTGLLYLPGRHAENDEVLRLARVAAERDGVYATHMRSEGHELLEALDETLNIGRRTGIRVQVSHLKAAHKTNWPKMDKALSMIERARDEGMAVCSDRYPYLAGCTDLDVILPDWALRGSPQDVLDRLKDPQQRLRIEKDLHEERSEDDWSRIMVGTTVHPDHERFRGLRVAEVAETWGVAPEEAVTRLLVEDEGKTGGIFFGLSEENMYKVLSHPLVMVGSDASLRAPEGPLSMDHPHPRAYGTFPRVLRWALDGRICALPELVRKMTRLPAEQFGLKERGRIEPRAMADIVVFDPETIRDTATYAKPHQFPEGIETVVVNGVVTVEEGRITTGRGGRFLG